MAPKIKQRDDFMGQDQRALIFEDLSHPGLWRISPEPGPIHPQEGPRGQVNGHGELLSHLCHLAHPTHRQSAQVAP